MKNSKHLGLSVFLLVVFVAGCAFQAPGSGVQVPNNALTDRIRTQSVATAYAMLTVQAGKAAPPATPTPEIAPSPTPPAPTAASTSTGTPTSPAATPTGARLDVPDYPTYTSTPAQTDYTCSLVEIEPAAGQTITRAAAFDMVVRIQNTGAKAWDAGKILLMYTSGQKMHTKTSAVVLPRQVDVDGEFVFTVDMQAPDAPGTYKTTWALLSGRTYFCPVRLQVVVTQ